MGYVVPLPTDKDRVLELAKRMYGRSVRWDADQSVYDSMWANGQGKDAPEQSLMIDCARVAIRLLGPGSMAANTGQSGIRNLLMLRNVYKSFILTREDADEILAEFEKAPRVAWTPPTPKDPPSRAPFTDEDV